MAVSFLANAASASGAPSTVTTSPIDTTGADFLFLLVACDAGANPTVSDNKGNTWTALTSYVNGANIRIRPYYCIPSSVGSGHTFIATGSFVYASVLVEAFSGVKQTSPLDVENGASGFASTLQPGSVTPSENNELLISCLGINSSGTPISINSSFNKTDELNFVGGTNYGGALAYKIQTTASAENPTWTRTNTNGMAASIHAFKAATASGQPTIKRIASIPFLGGSLRQRNF